MLLDTAQNRRPMQVRGIPRMVHMPPPGQFRSTEQVAPWALPPRHQSTVSVPAHVGPARRARNSRSSQQGRGVRLGVSANVRTAHMISGVASTGYTYLSIAPRCPPIIPVYQHVFEQRLCEGHRIRASLA